MNIAVVGNKASTLIAFRLDLIESLIKKGHKVYAFSPSYSSSELEVILSAGATPVNFNISRTGLNPFNEISIIIKLRSLLKKHDIEVVFSYFIKPVIYTSLAARFANVKRIYSMIAGLGYTYTREPGQKYNFKRNVLRFFLKILFKFSLSFNNKVFFQNPDDLNLFVSQKIIISKQAVRVYGSGVNLLSFPFQQPVTDPVTFISTGRLIKEKGFLEFADAARLLKAKYDNLRFIILGGIDENPSGLSKEVISSWTTSQIIEWPGKVKNVQSWLSQASVFVLPSYYREGTPRSILEGMAIGLPIITTDLPGCKETVKDGYNGFLIPPKNVKILSKKMEKFILNKNLILEMGKQSRKMAEETYDVNKINETMINAMNLN